jgi:hypothetical protein
MASTNCSVVSAVYTSMYLIAHSVHLLQIRVCSGKANPTVEGQHRVRNYFIVP